MFHSTKDKRHFFFPLRLGFVRGVWFTTRWCCWFRRLQTPTCLSPLFLSKEKIFLHGLWLVCLCVCFKWEITGPIFSDLRLILAQRWVLITVILWWHVGNEPVHLNSVSSGTAHRSCNSQPSRNQRKECWLWRLNCLKVIGFKVEV